VAGREEQGCADKRTHSRARQHETLLSEIRRPDRHDRRVSMRSDGSLVALRRPLSRGLPLSHTSKEVAILPCYFFKAPSIVVSDGCPYLWATITQMNCNRPCS
jgi:hypothetical protein